MVVMATASTTTETAAAAATASNDAASSIAKFPRDWLVQLLRKHNYRNNGSEEENGVLRDKALVLAPMVDQSDLPFRLLCRTYGANLAFTPMIHARLFAEDERYREKFFNLERGTPLLDRPLIAQLCGSNAESVLQAAKLLQPHVDGIDLNCGCPQGIAKRGHYGAYLLEDEEALVKVVKVLTRCLSIPVSVKVRLLPDASVQDSLKLYSRLVHEGGISLLTIHGRNRRQKGPLTGRADWDAIRQAVELLGNRIPILANGSIASLEDARDCLQETGADGVMSSEAILEYPPLFSSTGQSRIGRLDLARQYLELCRQYPPDQHGQGSGLKCIRAHLHRFLHADLQAHFDLRTKIAQANSLEDLETSVEELQEIHDKENHDIQEEELSWYVRHRLTNENGENVAELVAAKSRIVTQTELDEDAAECMATMFGDDDEW